MTIEIELKIKREVKLRDITDLLVTAFEGGSNYWYWLHREDLPKIEEDLSISEVVAKKIYSDPEYSLPIYDIENPVDKLGELSQSSIVRALLDNPIIALKILDDGDYDANDADIILQCAVMGEILFS